MAYIVCTSSSAYRISNVGDHSSDAFSVSCDAKQLRWALT